MTWLTSGEILRVNARKFPTKTALKDIDVEYTYPELEKRTNMLANALLDIGLKKGDKMAILLYNCAQYIEIYIAISKIGVIAVPINYRYVGSEIEYVVNNSESVCMILGEDFVNTISGIRENLPLIENYIVIGEKYVSKNYLNYDTIISASSDAIPDVRVDGKDTWIILYTSGTTGKPKGVIRSHESYISFFVLNAVDYGFSENDRGLIVMPLYHVNSTFYGLIFLYLGAFLYVHRGTQFDPVELLDIIEKEKITFTSLIPTHYHLLLNIPEEIRRKYDLRYLKKILCSSAPAKGDIKKRIMKMFPNVELYEAYGSTEAGLVTLLKPQDQLRKLASIGQECFGIDTIKLLDEHGNEVGVGEVGELYSRGPMMFDGYYKMPDKTKSSFRGEYFSAGDLAKKDAEGYYYIVDRKDNMIITGGEHVYPSEVEGVIATHPKVQDVAIIGVPHDKWGEAVKAVVILKPNMTATEKEIIDYCAKRVAGYKKPKSVDFISEKDMPRTSTGKILHRVLRERYQNK
jgi:acyl-CoA synthetase (AMP-forming)/AMP-acid ligase II